MRHQRGLQQQPRPRAYARAKAHPDRRLWSLIWLFAAITVLISHQSFAAPVSKESLRSLENQVWTAEPSELGEIEYKVTRLIQEEPYSTFGHYLLAHLYLRQFKHDPQSMDKLRKASELGQQAMALAENAEYGYLISAEVLDMMGYAENAAKMIDPAVNGKITESWRTLLLRAQLLVGHRSTETLLSMSRQAMRLEPSAQQIIAPYVIGIIKAGHDYEQITATLEKWQKEFPNPMFLQSLAITYADQGKYDQALATYNRIFKTNPDHLDALINQGIIMRQHLAQTDQAKRIFQDIITEGKLADPEKRSLVHSNLAEIYLQESQIQKARELFLGAITKADNPLEWLRFSHESYRQTEQFDEFAKLLSELQQELPGTSLLYALQGEVLSEQLGHHHQAVEAYSNAILLEPEKTEYYNGLGLAYYRSKDLENALSIFSQAAKIDPRDATVRYNEACVLSILGRKHEALGSLKEAISLDPRLQKTAKSDQDFSNLRGTKQFEDLIGHSGSGTGFTQIP
jgi:tetratricopeptide (TPR) repeat protein